MWKKSLTIFFLLQFTARLIPGQLWRRSSCKWRIPDWRGNFSSKDSQVDDDKKSSRRHFKAPDHNKCECFSIFNKEVKKVRLTKLLLAKMYHFSFLWMNEHVRGLKKYLLNIILFLRNQCILGNWRLEPSYC